MGNLAEVAKKLVQRLSDVQRSAAMQAKKISSRPDFNIKIYFLWDCSVSNCILKTQATRRSRLNFMFIFVCFPTVIRLRIFPRVVTLMLRNL